MLKKAELFSLEIPFKFGYDHAMASRLQTQSLILKLTTNDGITGYGETAPRMYVTGENYSTIQKFLSKHISLLNNYDGSLEGVLHIIQQLAHDAPAGVCLLESALLHLTASSKNQDLAKLIGISFDEPQLYSATITGGKREEFLLAAKMFHQNNMAQVKLKLVEDNTENLWRIRYLKDLYKDEVNIRIDGNGIWEFDKNRNEIQELIHAGITWWEQPFKKGDIASAQKFHDKFSSIATLILDDDITTADSLEKWINTGYIQGINLKIAKNGGLFRSIDLANKASEAGLEIQLGSHVGETSLLSYMGTLLAARFSDDMRYHEGCFSEYLLIEDPFKPKVQFGYKGELNPISVIPNCSVDLHHYPYSQPIQTWDL